MVRKLFLKLKLILEILLYSKITRIGNPWPEYQHDNKNTGQSQHNVTESDILKWVCNIGWGYFSSVPDIGLVIGSDGTIYVGREDYTFYAVNANGTLKWKFTTWEQITTTPAIGIDGTIYIGGQNNRLYAINRDGKLKWKYKAELPLAYSVSVDSDGTIYFISIMDYSFLYAVNPNGTLKWKKQTEYKISSDPAIGDDGTIYVGSHEGFLYVIDPDGTSKEYEVGGVLTSTAINNDGTIYVTSRDGFLYAVNPDGTLKWEYPLDDAVFSDLAISNDGTVYLTVGIFLHAIAPDGTLKWKYQTEYTSIPRSYSVVIGRDGTIFVVYKNNLLHAVNPDGTFKSEYECRYGLWSSPVIGSDGTIYCTSDYLYAIGELHVYDFIEKLNNGNLIKVSLSMDAPGIVYWRVKPIRGSVRDIPWQEYSSPINLTKTTVIQFYAENELGTKTKIQEKKYKITP